MQILAIPGGTKAYDATFDRWDGDNNGSLSFAEIGSALLDLEAANPDAMKSAHETVDILAAD